MSGESSSSQEEVVAPYYREELSARAASRMIPPFIDVYTGRDLERH
jgi:hypothetical protein